MSMDEIFDAFEAALQKRLIRGIGPLSAALESGCSMPHWAEKYVGQRWEAGAQGPDAWDCWAFLRHVLHTYYGLDVPEIVVADYEDEDAMSSLFIGHAERREWRQVPAPVDGCLVEIRRPSMHVGIWLDVDGGGVLHCARGIGVTFTKDRNWGMSGFGRRRFFVRDAQCHG